MNIYNQLLYAQFPFDICKSRKREENKKKYVKETRSEGNRFRSFKTFLKYYFQKDFSDFLIFLEINLTEIPYIFFLCSYSSLLSTCLP